MIKNTVLLGVQEQVNSYFSMEKEIKKLINKCNFEKFKNDSDNFSFFSIYFLNNATDDKFNKNMFLNNWLSLYINTLDDTDFYKKLGYFISLYYPSEYKNLFMGIKDLYDSEIKDMKNKLSYMNKIKSTLNIIKSKFDSLFNVVLPQIQYDQRVLKFKQEVLLTLNDFYIKIDGDIMAENNKLSEVKSEKEQNSLNNGEEPENINESIVDRAKAASVDIKKIEDAFDTNVMKALTKMKAERREAKHKEMVGESLRISREIKRVLKVLPLGLINPAIMAIVYIVSIIVDNETDAKDKAVLIGDLKLEIKIMDQKIETADRKGDEKEKIQMIRAKDKLERELERMQTNRTDYNKTIQ